MEGTAFFRRLEGLLELMRQSNNDVASDEGNVDMVAHLIHNPRGGVKHKLESLLECELIEKDATYTLCLTILMQPGLSNAEALKQGRELHRLAGLEEETMVTL